MKSWIETFSISMKLPTHSDEAYIWDYLIHNYPTKDDELLQTINAIPLTEYADIGLSLLKWFIDKKKYLSEQDLNQFTGLLESILDIWCEEVKDKFETLTFEDKNHVSNGLFRMSRSMQDYTNNYPFFQLQIDKLNQFRSSLNIIKYDPLDLKKIQNNLNKTTHWSEAIAISLQLPIKTKIIQLIDYIVIKYFEDAEYFLEGIATIDIDLYPKIGEALLDYFIVKNSQSPDETFSGYTKFIDNFIEFWFERVENIFSEVDDKEQEDLLTEIEKFDEKVEDLLEDSPIFGQCHEKINELLVKLESIEAEEDIEEN